MIDAAYSRIQIDVAGPTCRQCDPAAFDRAEEPEPGLPGGADRPERVFKVWLASQDRAASRVEIRDIPVEGQVARRVEYRPTVRVNLSQVAEQGQEPVPVVGRRASWANDVEAKLGTGAWRVVRPAWQEEHCDLLAALAEALDQIWMTVRAGASLAYRVVVRLQGLPEIVNVLVAEIVARSAAEYYRPPLPTLADHVRQVGVAACAATNTRACASLGATVERLGIAAVPEQLPSAAKHELVQRLIDELNLPVSWAGRTMPALEDTFWLMVAPDGQALPQAEQPPRPIPEGRLESTRERIQEARNLDTVTRPLTFGDVGG